MKDTAIFTEYVTRKIERDLRVKTGFVQESHFKDLNTCIFGVPSLSVLVLVSFESDTSHDVRNVLVNLENARRSSLPLVLCSWFLLFST